MSIRFASACFLVFFFSSSLSQARVLLDRIEGTVNRSLILSSDVQTFKKTLKLRAQLDPLFAGSSIAKKTTEASKEDIIQFLVDERVISEQFPVTDAEVEQEINTIQSNNRIDRKTLRSTLASQGFDFSDYFELIRISIAKRNLIDRDIRTKVFISDEDIKNHFFQNVMKKEGATFSYSIKIVRGTNRDQLKIIRDQLKSGDSFATVSARHESDPTLQFTDLGYLSDNEMSAAIKSEVKKMKIGDSSEILPADGSTFMVVRLDDIRTGQEERLKQVRDEIQSKLLTQEYQHQIQLWLERQRQNVYLYLNKG